MGETFEDFCGGEFWNETILLDNWWPQMTQCFRALILDLVACYFLWICSVFYIPVVFRQTAEPRLPFSLLNLIKTFCSSALALINLVNIFRVVSLRGSGYQVPSVLLLSNSIQFLSYLLTILLMQLDRIRGVFTSGLLFVFWTLLLVCDIIPFYTLIIEKEYEEDLLHFVLFYVSFGLVILQFILQWRADVPRKRQGYGIIGPGACPEVTASFPSRMVYWWMTKLVIAGYRKGIAEEDLWDLNPRDQSDTLVPPFEMEWEKEIDRVNRKNLMLKEGGQALYSNGNVNVKVKQPVGHSEKTPLWLTPKSKYDGSTRNTSSSVHSPEKSNKSRDPSANRRQPSLMKVLWRLYGCSLTFLFGVKLVADVLQLCGPLVMSELINFISNKEPGRDWKGYVLATLLLILSLVRSVFYQCSLNLAAILGMQMKTSIIAAVYKKALTISNEAKKTTTTGEIVNLMSVDCQRINEVMNYLFLLWSVPVQIVLSIVLLYATIGPSVFSGLVVLLIMIPFNAFLANKQRTLQQSNLVDKDQRIKLLNEILNGIKVLKLYAWETSFKEKVEAIRKKEILSQLRIGYLSMILGLGWTVAPFLVILATFATYVLIDPTHNLDANKAFVTLSLFNILRVPMNLLSSIMSFCVQAYVSVKRVNRYLCTEDLDKSNVIYDEHADYAISVEKGTFTWDRDMPPTLRNINLKIPEGKLIAVVGQVGSGKSSLVSAVLGEMEKISGEVTVKSSIAYVPQQAWIQNATLRDNILFGKKWREKKYNAIVDACALGPDLEILAAGDQTEIGEKGINLSGGQKQRVSLARAVYSNSRIYLFDDPLSAVDSHVGKHIFNNVIGASGMLKDKTRILVTHGVHWLPMVDHIIVLSDGVITEAGRYEELMSREGHFSEFLKTYLIERDEEDEEEEDLERRHKSEVGYYSDSSAVEEDYHVQLMLDIPKLQPLDEEDEELFRMIKEKMLERLDSITSDGTSGDELVMRRRRRRSSRLSESRERSLSLSTKEKKMSRMKENKGRLTQIEAVETGKVNMGVFVMYGKAAGLPTFLLSILAFFGYQAINTGASFYLTDWTDDPYLNNASSLPEDEYVARNEDYLGKYASFALGMLVMVGISNYFFWTRLVRAAARLHSAILRRIFRSPMSFFETTPLGRIINRLSRDVETIDNTLPNIIRMFMTTFANVLSTLIIICINTPIFISVMVPLLILYYFIQNFYIPTSRQLKRIESVTRSPVYIHFSETITGASSIRAYRAAERFIAESKQKVDRNQVFYFGGIVSNRWLAFYLDLIGTAIIFASAIFAVITPGTSGGDLGLSVSYALQISGAMGWMVKQISDLETNIVSVERVKEYSELSSEADWVLPDSRPPPGWPQHGQVDLRNYMTRYREGLDLVLKGLTCTVEGGQKIGIVGRTGAGKSSFTLALFRILEAAGGSIVIDGINIAEIGLHDVRSRLTILPQDPVLFSGSLRMNLDPFNEFNDDEIWRALDRAHLKKFAVETQDQLMYECGEGGENLSVGQRQLVCLARALLRHTKILVLDEATAAVDMETDSLIQKTIREAFAECTIITIAHRLNTVMDYDRIIVMDAGNIKEYDSPENLIQDKTSIFYGMARNAGLV